MYDTFRENYSNNNSKKKKLTLAWNYGAAKMLAHFNDGRITYEFVASLRQTVVLLLFNKFSQLSFDQLLIKTKMAAEPLVETLTVFIKYGLFQVVEESKSEQKAREETQGKLNTMFW